MFQHVGSGDRLKVCKSNGVFWGTGHLGLDVVTIRHKTLFRREESRVLGLQMGRDYQSTTQVENPGTQPILQLFLGSRSTYGTTLFEGVDFPVLGLVVLVDYPGTWQPVRVICHQ